MNLKRYRFCLVLGLIPWTAWGQNVAPTFEERLAALERRVEQLEKENQDLKKELSRGVQPPASELASLAPESLPPVKASVAAPASAVAARAVQAPPAKTESKGEAKPERLQFGGQVRFRGEARDNVGLRSSVPDTQDFIAQRVRFHLRGRVTDTVETFLEFQDSRLWGQELSTSSNDNLTDLHQGYLQINDFLKPGLSVRAGRQELIYGAERLVGALGWDNVGRSFDALKLGYSAKNYWMDGFAAKVIDRRDTGRGGRDQYLYGLYNQFFRLRPQHLEVYGILFRDGLRIPGEIKTQGVKATELMTVGLRSEGRIEPGFNYDVEFAEQFGHRGFDAHSARALAAKAYKTIEETHQLRVGFEYDAATGDRDPHDGRSGEFFNLFPTNHQHYGYADLMGWRNMQDFRPMFTVAPVRPLRFDFDYHRLYLLQSRGPWKDAAGNVLGFDPTGQSGTHVGDELDFTLAFPIHKNVRILSGYSLFMPGKFAAKTRGPDNQNWLFLQTLVDF